MQQRHCIQYLRIGCLQASQSASTACKDKFKDLSEHMTVFNYDAAHSFKVLELKRQSQPKLHGSVHHFQALSMYFLEHHSLYSPATDFALALLVIPGRGLNVGNE